MNDYPEHDRMSAVKDQSQAIGSFLEWLSAQGISFARWEHHADCNHESGPLMDDGGQKWQCREGRMVGHRLSNKPGVIGSECKRCYGTGRVQMITPRLALAGERTEALLARFFDIDLDKVEDEKRAMLASLGV